MTARERDPNCRGLYLLDKVKTTDICQSLNIEPLRIEQSQLHWYGHVTQMSHERTAKQLMDALLMAKAIEGDLELAGGIMLETWPGRVLEFHLQNCC